MPTKGQSLLVLQVVLLSSTGAFMLHAFYQAVRFRWPESYIGTSDAGVYRLLASPTRYALFRAFPVYLVCAVVAVSAERADLPVRWAVAAVVAMHASHTNVRALMRDARLPGAAFRHRIPIFGVRLAGLVAMSAAGWVAVETSAALEPVIPPLRELASTLLTALTAGVIGAYLLKVSADGANMSDLIAASRHKLSPELWQLGRDLAELHGADPQLVRAVMLVENIQRPRWLRRLERLKAIVAPAGTYGVMQVAADGPITDEESIRRASRLLAGETVRHPEGYLSLELIKAVAHKYNPDPGYPSMLWEALMYVEDVE